MDVDDFNLIILFEVLTKLGDVNIHRASVEVVVVNPDSLQSIVALQYFVGMSAEQSEELILLCGELSLLISDREELLLSIESKSTYMIDSILASLLTFYSSEDSLDTHHELFHRERFSDIVVGTNLETF